MSREREPYMGIVRVGRCSGSAHLFDSDVQHQHFIYLEVCEADIERHLSMNWIHSGKQIVGVWMSEMQWAHFVSSFNQGEGSPCTIRHIMGKQMAEPMKPQEEKSKFESEMRQSTASALQYLNTAKSKIDAVLEPGAKQLNKGELKEILRSVEFSIAEFTNCIPFVEKQFTEHLETKIVEAKTEFEGYMNQRLKEYGLERAQIEAEKAEAPQPAFLTDGGKS